VLLFVILSSTFSVGATSSATATVARLRYLQRTQARTHVHSTRWPAATRDRSITRI